MGGLVSSLGLGEGGGDTGASGTKFAASGVNLLNPTTEGQANTAYTQTQAGLAQQQAFVNALQAQNGIGNQSDVYNQLSGVVAGTGPNPAQAQLAQATGANVANQAALMAGQRGAGANAGLIARQAGMQGGALQQQAAGQGATMQAQQALNALNMQGGLATQQVGQQAGALQSYNAGAQNQQQTLLNSITGENNSNVAMRANQNQVNGGIAGTVAQGQQAVAGGIMQGLGGAAGLMGGGGGGMAHGGMVQGYADGGDVMPSSDSLVMPQMGSALQVAPAIPTLGSQLSTTEDSNAPKSNVGKFHKQKQDGTTPTFSAASSNTGAQALQQGASSGISSLVKAAGPALMALAHGGAVKAMLSPDEGYLPPDKAQAVAEKKASPIAEAQVVPGKAQYKGDTLKNDTVPATLEEGGVVIPRSIMEAKDAEKKAAAFVAAHLRKTRNMLPSKGR